MHNAGKTLQPPWRTFVTAFVLVVSFVVKSAGTEGYKHFPPCIPKLHNESENVQTPCRLVLGFLPVLQGAPRNKYFLGAFFEALNRFNGTLMGGYYLDSEIRDNRGDTLVSIRAMTEMHSNNVAAYIGPEDTCQTESVIAQSWNIPMIAFNCRDHIDHNRTPLDTQTFIRTMPSATGVAKSVISVMQHFDWHRLTPIVQNSSNLREALPSLRRLSSQYGIEVNTAEFLWEPYLAMDVQEGFGPLIERTKDKTRVYVFLGEKDAMIDFVRAKHEMSLSAEEYVVIAVQEAPYDPDKHHEYVRKYSDRSDHLGLLLEHTIEALEGVMIISPRPPSHPRYEDFLNTTVHFSKSRFKVPIPPKGAVKNLPDLVPIFAAYLYDAVYLYARALNQTIADGEDPFNSTHIISKIRNRRYQSIQGHDIFMDEYGEAEANFTVLYLQPDKTSAFDDDQAHILHHGLSVRPVAYFKGNGTSIPKMKMVGEISWPSGSPPPSQPKCGFDGELCASKKQKYWQNIIIALVAISVGVVATVTACRHYRYEQKIASLTWKIEYKDLLMAEPDHDPNLSEKLKHLTVSEPRCSFFIGNVQHKTFGRLSYLSLEDSHEHQKPGRQAFTKVASFKGSLVAVKVIKKKHVEITRACKKELHLMRDMSHDNVNRFMGACVEPPNVCIVTQYCARGSLKDILENDDIHLDEMLIASLVFDLLKGMIYLHECEVVSHGNLKPTNCLVDSRWVLKVADFGLHTFRTPDIIAVQDERLLWTAPELLRHPCPPQRGSPKGDVYSFSLILYEIHGRCGPWGHTLLSHKEIIDKVKEGRRDDWVLRPDVSQLQCEDFIVRGMQEAWHEDPDFRPDFKYMRVRLKPMQRGLKSNIFDNMLAIMEKYATTLETLVDERTNQLAEEKKKTENLLLRMLPKTVAEQLIGGESVVPEQYESVTIYFSDVVGFTSLSAMSSPMQVVDLLNDLYTLFDSIIENYDVYKVETIGDAYMVVSGLPLRNGDNHAGEIASMSLHLLSAIKDFKIRHMPEETLKLRIGIHTGSCVAGVVGLKMPRYCLFGDTVNTSSRMESTGLELKIHCSAASCELLNKLGGYTLEKRGEINIKGKGSMVTYFLIGEDATHRLRRIAKEKMKLSASLDNGIQRLHTISIKQSLKRHASARCSSVHGKESCEKRRSISKAPNLIELDMANGSLPQDHNSEQQRFMFTDITV